MTSALCEETILKLVDTYPFLRTEVLTTTAFGRPVRTLTIGEGDRKVIYSAAHHANEWITTPERSFGSNHVVFGGMMLPVSAMLMSCCIETG